MKKTFLILLATMFAMMAFGQGKSKTTNSIYLYRKADYNAMQYLVPEGSQLDLIANHGEFWEVKYQEKVRYMPHDYEKDVIPADSIPPPKPIPIEKTPLPIDSLTKRINFTEVVKVDTVTPKDQLFVRAREWFAKTYNSSKDVIQMEDKASGKLVGKAIFESILKYKLGIVQTGGNVAYTISITVKDGRYKYEITDFNHQGYYYQGTTITKPGPMENFIVGDLWSKDQWIEQINFNALGIIASLKKAMTIPSLIKTKDDW